MTTPGNLDVEAFQTMMRAWVDELSTKQTENLNKQTENLNARIDELKESNKKQLEEQTENFRQDTIKIAESLEELKIDNLQLKQDNIEIKQSIIDGTAQLTEKIVNTNLRIDTIAENVCGIINKQTELTCEKIICEEFIVVENTCVITNDNYKVINIKEEKEIKVNKTYLINLSLIHI